MHQRAGVDRDKAQYTVINQPLSCHHPLRHLAFSFHKASGHSQTLCYITVQYQTHVYAYPWLGEMYRSEQMLRLLHKNTQKWCSQTHKPKYPQFFLEIHLFYVYAVSTQHITILPSCLWCISRLFNMRRCISRHSMSHHTFPALVIPILGVTSIPTSSHLKSLDKAKVNWY